MMPELPQWLTLITANFWGVWALVCLLIALMVWSIFRLYFFSQHHLKLWADTLKIVPKARDKAVVFAPELMVDATSFKIYFLQAYRLGNWRVKESIYLGMLICLALISSILVGSIIGVLLGLTAGLFIFCVGIGLVFLKALDQKNKAIEQLPSFLEALSQSLQAGYSVTAALGFMADELDPPLQHSIRQLNYQLSLQVPLEVAFQDLAKTFNQPEIDFLVEGTLVQVKIGGNLVVLFENMGQIIEEKLKLKRDIKSFTSQGKLSGLFIATLWPISLLLFAWLSPQHTEVLFFTTPGQILLFISLFLQLVGFFFIWRIIRVQI
jgi:tight adherence protein B